MYLYLLLSVIGLCFIMSQAEGPFGLFSKIRSYLFRHEYLGVYFYKLFQCPFCLGINCGMAIFLFYHNLDVSLNDFVCFSLASGAMNKLFNKLVLE